MAPSEGPFFMGQGFRLAIFLREVGRPGGIEEASLVVYP
jgi:hypothetical protein